MRLAGALLIAVLASSSPLAAQTSSTDSAPRRSPKVATVLSAVIPGAGQFYTGNYIRGLVVLAGTVGGAALVAHACSNDSSNCTGNREIGWTLVGSAWLVGVYSAGDEARDFGRPPDTKVSDAEMAKRLVATIGPVIARDSVAKR